MTPAATIWGLERILLLTLTLVGWAGEWWMVCQASVTEEKVYRRQGRRTGRFQPGGRDGVSPPLTRLGF